MIRSLLAPPRSQAARPQSVRLNVAREQLGVSVAAADGGAAALAGAALACLGFTPDPGSRAVTRARLVMATAAALPLVPAEATVIAQSGPDALLRRGRTRYFSRPGIFVRLGGHGRALLWAQAGGASPELIQDTVTRVTLLLLSQAGWDTLHGAGLVSPDGQALIITGPSGSGKSTLTLGLARRGWPVLSDDLLLVAEEQGRVSVRGWLTRVRLCADTLASVPALAAEAEPQFDAKWAVAIELLGGRIERVASPALIVLPRIVDRETSALTPVASATAMVAVARQLNLSAGADPALTGRQLARAARLVGQSRCFALEAGRDLARDPGLLADLLAAAN